MYARTSCDLKARAQILDKALLIVTVKFDRLTAVRYAAISDLWFVFSFTNGGYKVFTPVWVVYRRTLFGIQKDYVIDFKVSDLPEKDYDHEFIHVSILLCYVEPL